MKATTLIALPLIGLALGTAVGVCRADDSAAKAAQAVAPSLDQSLLTAAEKGDEEAVRRLLKAGADVNAKDKSGATPLHEAARRGHTGAVRLLVEAGADANGTSRWKPAPLDLGKTECMGVLRKFGGKRSWKSNFLRLIIIIFLMVPLASVVLYYVLLRVLYLVMEVVDELCHSA